MTNRIQRRRRNNPEMYFGTISPPNSALLKKASFLLAMIKDIAKYNNSVLSYFLTIPA